MLHVPPSVACEANDCGVCFKVKSKASKEPQRGRIWGTEDKQAATPALLYVQYMCLQAKGGKTALKPDYPTCEH